MLAEKWVGYCKVSSLWGMAVVCQADYIISAAKVNYD